MIGLDRELRLSLEEGIDNRLKDPRGSEESCSVILEAQRIRRSFETILAFIADSVFGGAYAYYATRYRREAFAFTRLDDG